MSFFRGARLRGSAGGGRHEAFLVTDPELPRQLAAVFGGAAGSRRRRPVIVDMLTLADVTSYFASERPPGPDIKATALLFAPHPSGRQVFQVFLDEADRLCADASGTPYGRRIIARHLDEELLGYLGGGELLIFR